MVGYIQTSAALDREALLDVDGHFGGEVEVAEREVDDAVSGVLLRVAALGVRDAGVVGGEGDGGVRRRACGDGDNVMKRERLVERGERVESVRTCWADGEAEVDLRERAEASGHPKVIVVAVTKSL